MAKSSAGQLMRQLNVTSPKRKGAVTEDDEIVVEADVEDDDADDDADVDDDNDTDDADESTDDDEDDKGDDKDDQDDEDDEEVDEDALPDPVKAILKKNRDEVRDVKKENRRLKRDADKFQKLYVKRAAADALREAGLSGKPDRFLRMLDLDTVEVDEDGEIDGLEEQVEEIKADFEDLFVKEPVRTPRRRVAGDGAPRSSGPVPKTSAERLTAQLTGR